MADTERSDDEGSAVINVNVKTPTSKEAVEVNEKGSVKDVSFFRLLLELHWPTF